MLGDLLRCPPFPADQNVELGGQTDHGVSVSFPGTFPSSPALLAGVSDDFVRSGNGGSSSLAAEVGLFGIVGVGFDIPVSGTDGGHWPLVLAGILPILALLQETTVLAPIVDRLVGSCWTGVV